MTYGTLGNSFNLTDSVRTFLVRNAMRLAGCAAFVAAALTTTALVTWRADDPSLSHAVNRPVENLLGFPGAALADILMQLFGLAAVLVVLAFILLGWTCLRVRPLARPLKRTGCAFGALLLLAMALACLPV